MLSFLKKSKTELTEASFAALLPEHLQKASHTFFTPLNIGQTAAQWLTEDGNKTILDIGAGVGKFCVTGAKCNDSFYYGIEYRKSLAKIANRIIAEFEIKNAMVEHDDIAKIDFQNYDAFYLYNPFYENVTFGIGLNREVELSFSLYEYYSKYTENALEKTKPGTRLVTYHGNNFEVPGSFKKIKENDERNLKLWIKQ